MKLNLEDLQPENAQFKLSEKKDEVFTLGKVTLRTHVWLKNKFGANGGIKDIFSNQKMAEISEIAFHLLKEKDKIKSVEDLQDLIVTQRDRIEIIQALLKTIGLSQPVLEKLAEQEKLEEQEKDAGETVSPTEPTGADSTTS